MSIESVVNEKPQVKATTSTQGKGYVGSNGKDTTPAVDKARYEKGLELYKSGAVSIGQDGYFKVLGFTVDTQKVSCDCPEKKPCIHYFAACQFQKNGKPDNEKIHYREGNGHDKPQDNSNSENKARGEAQVSSRVKLRLSALSLAVQVLQTYNKPISSKNLFKVAGELEDWALEK